MADANIKISRLQHITPLVAGTTTANPMTRIEFTYKGFGPFEVMVPRDADRYTIDQAMDEQIKHYKELV